MLDSNCEQLISMFMYDYQKKIWNTVIEHWDKDVNLVFDKQGRQIGRTSIAKAIYWLFKYAYKDMGKEVLLMTSRSNTADIFEKDVISMNGDISKHRGKDVGVIIFDDCPTDAIDNIMFELNAKGVILNNEASISLEDISSDFIKVLDIIEYAMWDNMPEFSQIELATRFAKLTQPSFLIQDNVYINFNQQNGRDM